MAQPKDDAKRQALAREGVLNPHPEAVEDPLFTSNPFFDPRDLVQVRYEMVRRHQTEGQAVSDVAAAFGSPLESPFDSAPGLRDLEVVDALNPVADHLAGRGDIVVANDSLVRLVPLDDVALLESDLPVLEEAAVEEPCGVLVQVATEAVKVLAVVTSTGRVLSRHRNHLRDRSLRESVARGGRGTSRSLRHAQPHRSNGE